MRGRAAMEGTAWAELERCISHPVYFALSTEQKHFLTSKAWLTKDKLLTGTYGRLTSWRGIGSFPALAAPPFSLPLLSLGPAWEDWDGKELLAPHL